MVKGGHEVQIWTDIRQGVFSLTGTTGPVGIRKTLRYAADGINFKAVRNVDGTGPVAPGLFRTELAGGKGKAQPEWGVHINRLMPFTSLGRFEMKHE